MTSESWHEKAQRFRALHDGPEVLVLANAWDPTSARAVAAAGAAALATSSAAVARALGSEDGEQLAGDEMLAAVERIVAAVELPVSADLEAGYGETPDAVGSTAAGAVAVGACGMNLEDHWHRGPALLRPVADQVERIAAAVAAAPPPFVVNARIDVYLVGRAQEGPAAEALDETLRRAAAYVEAGAGCIFVPGVTDADLIATLVREIPAPLNVLVFPGTPPVPRLRDLGVRRVSLGSGLHRFAMKTVEQAARTLFGAGTYPGED